MSLRQSHTTVVERNQLWRGPFETEPCEAAWSSEALFFIRALDIEGQIVGTEARVQISPDGMHWCDEGTVVSVPSTAGATAFGRVTHYGGWLRLVGALPEGGAVKVIVHLVLKA